MNLIDPSSEHSPETEQKIHLLKVAINKTIGIIESDLVDLRAILECMECDIEGQDLEPEDQLRFCPHCCLVEEEKRKSNHFTYLQDCLKTCK